MRSLFECRSNEKGEDQKKKKVFIAKISTNSGCRLKILAIFYKFLSEDQKTKTKERSSSQKFYEIRCESTKFTKKPFLLANSRAVNTILGVLGLDLHSSSPEPVTFFGAQSSLGGHNFRLGGHKQSFGGARPKMPSRGAGPEPNGLKRIFANNGSSGKRFRATHKYLK